MNKKFSFKSYGKLNLFLRIIGRKDNLHLLEMINTEITLSDEISGEIEYPGSGIIEIRMSPDYNLKNIDNLVYKTSKLYMEKSNIKFDISFYIKKIIPPGSGLAGGSSNSAYTLLFLNSVFNKFSIEELIDIGFNIGSDVPFFLIGGLCKVSGFGEKVTPAENKYIGESYFLVIIPDFALSTKKVYEAYDLSMNANKDNIRDFEDFDLFPLKNDLYRPAKTINPEIEELLEDLSNTNPQGYSMTGSGSGCYAIYKNKIEVEKAFNNLKNKYKKIFIVFPKLNRNI